MRLRPLWVRGQWQCCYGSFLSIILLCILHNELDVVLSLPPPSLPPQIDYPAFTRDFYIEHDEISTLTSAEVRDLRSKMGLKVTGFQAPKPCVSFAHFNFDESLMNIIRKSEYSQPTGIQSLVS